MKLQTDIASEQKQIKELTALRKQQQKQQSILDKNFKSKFKEVHHISQMKALSDQFDTGDKTSGDQTLILRMQETLALTELTRLKLHSTTEELNKVTASRQVVREQIDEQRLKLTQL